MFYSIHCSQWSDKIEAGIDGLAQDCMDSIADMHGFMGLPQSCTKPLICMLLQVFLAVKELKASVVGMLDFVMCVLRHHVPHISSQWVGAKECVRNDYTDGLVQDFGISSANALEIPQSCTKPSLALLHQSLHLIIMNYIMKVGLGFHLLSLM